MEMLFKYLLIFNNDFMRNVCFNISVNCKGSNFHFWRLEWIFVCSKCLRRKKKHSEQKISNNNKQLQKTKSNWENNSYKTKQNKIDARQYKTKKLSYPVPHALIEGTMRHDIAQVTYASKVYVPCPCPIWLLLVFNFYYFPNIKKETIIVIIVFLLSYLNEVT